MSHEEVSERIVVTRAYLNSKPVKKEILDLCKNENELCTLWVLIGECEKNPACKSSLDFSLAFQVLGALFSHLMTSLFFLIFLRHEERMCPRVPFMRLSID